MGARQRFQAASVFSALVHAVTMLLLAHAMRASLLAMATTTTFFGARTSRRVEHTYSALSCDSDLLRLLKDKLANHEFTVRECACSGEDFKFTLRISALDIMVAELSS